MSDEEAQRIWKEQFETKKAEWAEKKTKIEEIKSDLTALIEDHKLKRKRATDQKKHRRLKRPKTWLSALDTLFAQGDISQKVYEDAKAGKYPTLGGVVNAADNGPEVLARKNAVIRSKA